MNTFKKLIVSGFSGIIFGIFAVLTIGACLEIGGTLGYSIEKEEEPIRRVREERAIEEIEEDDEEDDKLQAYNEIDGVVPSSQVLTTNSVTYVVTDVTDVVENVMPSIVSITNNYTYNYYYYSAEAEAKGSGIIVGKNDEELLIATNYHVISDNDELTVTFYDDSEAPAQVKGSDAGMDLAVIAVDLDDIEDIDAIKIASIGDSESLKVGEPVVAIGNALGYGQSVTSGVVSALNREMDMGNDGNTAKYIQTDAAINQGNSGGALLNMAGEVIGINSNKIGGSTVEGMGYAIPISAARPIIEDLMLRETRYQVDEDKQGCIGISGSNLSSYTTSSYGIPTGVYVENVFDDSAADEIGLKKGDIITSFDGQSLTSMEQLQKILTYYEEGETVEITYYRKKGREYKEYTKEITLGNKDILN